MSGQHRATAEQWEIVEICREKGKIPWPTATALLELRARIEALEADQLEHAESNRFCVDAIVRRVEALEAPIDELRAPTTEARPTKPSADDARALLLWLLWHHQGARSDVGQPIRDLLGMGRYEPMSDEQLRIAREWGDQWLRGEKKTLAQPHPAPSPATTPEARPGGLVERVADSLCCDPHLHAKARAAIREVAAAARGLRFTTAKALIDWLERQAGRG
jgi:hypothetical protein